MLRLALSDYIDRIVDGRGLRQRVITQPRPKSDIPHEEQTPPKRGLDASKARACRHLRDSQISRRVIHEKPH